MKTFTLDEAQNLLPVAESLLNRATEAKQAAQELDEKLSALMRYIVAQGGVKVNVGDVQRRRTTLEALVQRAKDSLAELDAIGVQVKDLDNGLLDFPCELDGETVLLCWKRGEPRIAYWHRIEDGFRGRQPIDARFSRVEPDKLH
jgi:hypothetical protein